MKWRAGGTRMPNVAAWWELRSNETTRDYKRLSDAAARAWHKTAFLAVQTAGIRITVCPSQTGRFRTYGGWNGNRRYGSDR